MDFLAPLYWSLISTLRYHDDRMDSTKNYRNMIPLFSNSLKHTWNALVNFFPLFESLSYIDKTDALNTQKQKA